MMKTNYEVLRDSYLEKAGNRKLYEIELAKLALVEAVDGLSKDIGSKSPGILCSRCAGCGYRLIRPTKNLGNSVEQRF